MTTLAEVVRDRRAAVAAAAAAMTATAVVTAVLATAPDDGEAGPTPDSLGIGSSESESPTPSPTPRDPETAGPSEEPEPEPEPTATEGSAEPRPERSATASPSPYEVDPRPQPTAYCTTHPANEPEPTPEPSPTSTAVAPVEPAPPSASASSTASPDGPSASPSPTRTTYTACAVPGRPMWRGGDLLVPDLRAGVAAGDLPVPDVSGLSPRDRAALARLWTAAARGELASVPAFADLALVLAALGAPLELVARATSAALDEVDHTRRSFALAGAYAGQPVEGGPVPGLLGRRVGQSSSPRAALTRLAVEALRDGCLHEGHAAVVARIAADGATDPAVRESLDVIAHDEARHTELSFDLLSWCLEAGDARLRTRVARELAALPVEPPAWATGDGDADVLEQHGWPGRERVEAAFTAHRTAVVAHGEGLLVGSL